MAISLSDNLAYSGSQSNFERDSYATLADMKSVKKTKMPNVMIAVCEETGKLYIYNKNNEADEELGLWREAGGEGGSADAIPTYEVGQMSTEDGLLSTDTVVEEIQKHTDQAFFVKQYNAYESRTWFVTYSPFMNYRRSNKWTAIYSNQLITIDKYDDTTGIPVSVQTFTLGASENLFNNNGPRLPIYSFTQGSKTSEEMLNLIGNNYYASYTGDYGRGNEPFIPGQVSSRADSCTVYIENAPKFGTQKCKLFAVNTVGEVFEGFFATQNTTPAFTSEGLVWKEVGGSDGSSSEETDTIDFSTWEEFQNPEANGIVLDGQGGANIDDSNVSVDPGDIEDDD